MESKDILKRTLIISIIVVGIDQILKILAIVFCSESSIEIIKNVFYLTKIENIGVAFGLNEGNIKNILISGVIIFLIIRYLITQKKYLNTITLTCLDLVVAGGISNLIDRIIRGGVIDFIQISDFPVFNLADVVVICGWILFSVYIIKFEFSKKW